MQISDGCGNIFKTEKYRALWSTFYGYPDLLSNDIPNTNFFGRVM
jgi:hypothetical protein